MNRTAIFILRWVLVLVGVGSAAVGFFNTALANETNNVCWIAVFLAFAPYPEKK